MCRNNKRCQKCSNNHDVSECRSPTTICIHCGSIYHDSLALICPQVDVEQNINWIKIENNITYTEAKRLIN